MGAVKYEQAFDSKRGRWVSVSDFNDDNKMDWYDKPRYYSSENIDDEDCEILTYVRHSKKFRRKNMKSETPDIQNVPHFASVGKNTYERRAELVRTQAARESDVHAIAKKVAEQLSLIKVPAIKVDVYGYELKVMPEQYLPVTFLDAEKYVASSETRPDILMKTKILGLEENLHVEILYSHRVEQAKKCRLQNAGIYCVEIDLSDLKAYRDLGKAELAKIIRERLINDSYWISNRLQTFFEDTISKYFLELSIRSKFSRSRLYDTFEQRAYVFRDSLGVEPGHPCYLRAEDSIRGEGGRAVEPCMCKKCDHCLFIKGYDDPDIKNLQIICDRLGVLYQLPRYLVMSIVKDKIISDYKEEYTKKELIV